MFALALGIALGLMVAAGPLTGSRGVADRLIDMLINGTSQLIDAAVTYVGGLAPATPALELVSIVLGFLTPGVVAAVLVLVAKGTAAVRRGLVALVAGVAIAAAFAYGTGALVIVAVLFPLLGLIVFVERAAATVAVALATIITVTWSRLLLHPDRPEVMVPATRFAEIAGFGEPRLVAAALSLSGLGVLAAAAARAIGMAPSSKK